MTCRPEPMNPLDALYQASRRYPGKLPALAHRVNMPEDTLRKKLRHQVETHILGYDEEVSEILDCLREAKVDGWADTIHAFCWRHGHLAIPIPSIDKSQAGGEEVTSAIVSSVKEHAEAIASIGESLSGDSVITDAELQRINKEIEEAMVALLELRNLSTMLHDLAKMRGVVLPMQRKF